MKCKATTRHVLDLRHFLHHFKDLLNLLVDHALANLRDLHILRDDLLLRDLSLHNRLLILDLWDLRAKKSSTSVFLGSLYKVCKP